ncbi:glycosyltransferase family 2 protein [Paraliobacillus zengyii]|uniref:glycosyltransferase family 2 protein n=1 Tax=Paraliobacillus zengyii TaxID=2213194 RepID=UPI000DD4796E|nr:glycosyltransferase family A protein [Paraliobacillus zengyii]
MKKSLLRLSSDITQYILDNVLTVKQRNYFKKSFSEKQKSYIRSLMRKGNRRSAIEKIDNVKYKLYNLGFTSKAYEELKSLAFSPNDPLINRLASWEIALWHANQYSVEDAEKALRFLPIAIKGVKDKDLLRRAVILEVESYAILGQIELAEKKIKNAIKNKAHPDLFLAYANLNQSPSEKIKWINKAYRKYGIARIELQSLKASSTYDSLIVKGIKNNYKNSNIKISVIIPVYNAEAVVDTALTSIINQTWRNIEVLVVDDCSTDNTLDIVKKYQSEDKRIKLLKTKRNGGAYLARNLALKEAKGEFVTINDADDWSHPQKIQLQAEHLLKNKSIIANMSEQARATNDLKFYRRGKPGNYIFGNMSSLMFRREKVLNKVGYWDAVRFAADSEFIKRIKKSFGEKTVVEIATGPLSFQRQLNGSLTGNSFFGFPGFFMGARKEYLEAQLHYHANTEDLKYPFDYEQKRPFPVPRPMLPMKEKFTVKNHFEVILISDFRLDESPTKHNLNEINRYKQLGIKIGLVQLNQYNYPAKEEINTGIRDTVDGDLVQIIVYGEEVSCNHLILRFPTILLDYQKYIPSIDATNIHIVVEQKDTLEDNLTLYNQRIEEYFGKKGKWIPTNDKRIDSLLKYNAENFNLFTLSEDDRK